jgi:hypothetical protein
MLINTEKYNENLFNIILRFCGVSILAIVFFTWGYRIMKAFWNRHQDTIVLCFAGYAFLMGIIIVGG